MLHAAQGSTLPVLDVTHVDGADLQLLVDVLHALHLGGGGGGGEGGGAEGGEGEGGGRRRGEGVHLHIDHFHHCLHRRLAPTVAQLAPQLPHLTISFIAFKKNDGKIN